MKALALAAALSIALTVAANAQDSKPSLKSNGVTKQPAEASATIDVSSIQKKIDEYTEAIKNDPKNDKFYGARGQSYQRIGNSKKAIEDLTKAISLNPNRQAYFIVRGEVYGWIKQYSEARDDFARAISAGPTSYQLYLKHGQAAYLGGDPHTAVQSAKSALAIKPDDIEALVVLGSAEQSLGLFDDSLKHLTRVIELSPTDAGAMKIRADTYTKLGKKELARKDEERAKQIGLKH